MKTIFLFFSLLSPFVVMGQTLTVVSETSEYTLYSFKNDSLKAVPPISIMADAPSGTPKFTLEQVVFGKSPSTRADLARFSTSGSQVTSVKNAGIYRKRPVASIELHVVSGTGSDIRILKSATIKVFRSKSSTVSKPKLAVTAKPFASGDWYKIPVSKSGIHQINRTYLQNLGIPVDAINPRFIQIWAGPGFELPKQNATPRPDFVEIPILVEGEADGKFDANDRILFFQNEPTKVAYSSLTLQFEHQIHKSSALNYVFVTVGTSNGKRFSPRVSSYEGLQEVTTFTDFIWKEEERVKPEPDIKSGSQWLGQSLSVQNTGSTQILTDTLAGFTSGPVTFEVMTANRSIGSSARFVYFVNGTARDSINVSSIEDFNGVTGLAARAGRRQFTTSVNTANGIIQLQAQYKHPNTVSSIAFVDYIRVWADRPLTPKRGMLTIYEKRSSGTPVVYRLQGFSTAPIALDVSNPINPIQLQVESAGSDFRFVADQSVGKIFVAQSSFITPAPGTKIAAQNLIGLSTYPQLVIVTSKALLEKAKEFATYRTEKSGFQTVVVTQEELFNEFSAGVPDFVAIRDYVKFLYDRATTAAQLPKYLLLFGDATYDYKRIEQSGLTNHVFTYQTLESLDRINSYGSDDFFGLLDESEGNWDVVQYTTNERVDIGIGRFPIQTNADADVILQKIKSYELSGNKGDWRTMLTFVSDDDVSGSKNDTDLHLINADVVAESIAQDASGVKLRKIHTMNYLAQTTAFGRRFPDATADLINAVNEGTLIVNYSGHGNERTLSDEKLFDTDYLTQFENADRLTIFVTATCSFGRFDDNEAQSGAEQTVLLPNAGMVASFTTTRTVFTSRSPGNDNFGLNMDLTRHMTSRNPDGTPLHLGEIYERTKNGTPGASLNGRKFILVGDPSMRFGLSQMRASIDSLNGSATANSGTFTLKALEKIRVAGFVGNGSADATFNGTVVISVFDGVRKVNYPEKSWTSTFCNFNSCSFNVQNDVLFRGQASVKNGRFSTEFIVPKDIQYSTAKGRIHIYAAGNDSDAASGFSNLLFNGIGTAIKDDDMGPEVKVFLNDTTFVSGGLVNPGATLVVQLADETGINTAGSGVGHELTATINTVPETVLSLNRLYTSKLDDYKQGSVRYPLPELPVGEWKAKIRAWDILNNMSESELAFKVARADAVEIANVYNYPNPMSYFTRFVFEHNLPAGTSVFVTIRVFTLTGKPVAYLKENLTTSGNLQQIGWNGFDADGDRLANGTYLYHIGIDAETVSGRLKTEKIEKLVIIR